MDNETRWLSQLYMIQQAIQLKTYIKTLSIVVREDWNKKNRSRSGIIAKHKLDKLPRYLQAENQLDDRDWDVLQHLESILTVFETVIKTPKDDDQLRIRRHSRVKSYGNVWNIILDFELSLGKLEKFKKLATESPNAEQFRVDINLTWEKLDKHYNLLNETPIYYTALALHPAYRWKWFDKIWKEKPDWITRAKAIVHEVWIRDCAQLDVCTSSRSSNEESPPTKRPRFFDPFAANDRLSQPSRSIAVIGDEYKTWQRDRERIDGDIRNPLSYWANKQDRYHRLSRIAMDFMTIQSMSAECERAFSAAGRMVTPIRARLDAGIVGICQVLRS
jgi:hypothetical protein